MALSGKRRIIRKSSVSTKQSRTKQIDKDKSKFGLSNVPSNYFTSPVQGVTGTGGIFGIGLLKPRPNSGQTYADTTNSQGRPTVSTGSVKKYSYFFLEYDNIFAATLDGYLYSFVIVKTLYPLPVPSVAYMLGVRQNKITPLTLSQYETDSFNHPKYKNQNGDPLSIRYAEITVLDQKTPGRLDNVSIGYPNFDSTPSPVNVISGPIPSKPIVDFVTGTGATSGTVISAGATVYFVDASVWNPATMRPTNWSWYFGSTSSASPTGSNSRTQVVTFGATGTFTVTLTAWNIGGTSSKTKTNFVTVI